MAASNELDLGGGDVLGLPWDARHVVLEEPPHVIIPIEGVEYTRQLERTAHVEVDARAVLGCGKRVVAVAVLAVPVAAG